VFVERPQVASRMLPAVTIDEPDPAGPPSTLAGREHKLSTKVSRDRNPPMRLAYFSGETGMVDFTLPTCGPIRVSSVIGRLGSAALAANERCWSRNFVHPRSRRGIVGIQAPASVSAIAFGTLLGGRATGPRRQWPVWASGRTERCSLDGELCRCGRDMSVMRANFRA